MSPKEKNRKFLDSVYHMWLAFMDLPIGRFLLYTILFCITDGWILILYTFSKEIKEYKKQLEELSKKEKESEGEDRGKSV